eukprot:CAMPEP_0118715892 /NCGR_PEP_ID=MMETSP0800-20121206/27173_1 /TAXON_ID=210618 ORGANISM="Striatella unipunctata, Strain CCMP2910" /NCGR_SAMPLE_ID=MMETSP0800 /ASSEMBLY_ACC=CAM_ASM_000638 /LENGTH=336 /DNA_ID=CAMNT_0006622203 /DNA_START=287 /DNA_END=1297 /DNA_ORIENTATION=-
MSMSFSYNTGNPVSPSSSSSSSPTTPSPTPTTTMTFASQTLGVVDPSSSTMDDASINDKKWFCLEPNNVVPLATTTLTFSYQAQVVNDQDDDFVTQLDHAMAYAMAKDGCTLGSSRRRALTASVEPSITMVSIDALPNDELLLQESCQVTNTDANACVAVLAGIRIVYKDVANQDANGMLQTQFEEIWKEHVDEWVASSANVVDLEYMGSILDTKTDDQSANRNNKSSEKKNDYTWKILLSLGVISGVIAVASLVVLSWTHSMENRLEKSFVETDSDDDGNDDDDDDGDDDDAFDSIMNNAGEDEPDWRLVDIPLNEEDEEDEDDDEDEKAGAFDV